MADPDGKPRRYFQRALISLIFFRQETIGFVMPSLIFVKGLPTDDFILFLIDSIVVFIASSMEELLYKVLNDPIIP